MAVPADPSLVIEIELDDTPDNGVSEVFALMLIALSFAALVAAQDTLVFTLQGATARALRVSPIIAAADSAALAPRGLHAETRWPFPDNPVVEFGRVRRQTASTSFRDQEWSVTQDIEIGFQSSLRGSAASGLVRSAEATAVDARRLVALEVRRAYAALAVAERRAALIDSAATFGDRLAAFARRQFETGESNRLELNAAVLEAARTRSTAERARAEAEATAADLARLLAIPLDTAVRAAGLPAAPEFAWRSDSMLLATAFARRADLRAARELQRSAELSLSASRRARVPNLSVSAVGGRESGTDDLLGLAVGLRIPLFHRQQAATGAARADQASARAAEASTERAIRAEVVAAAARFRRTRAAEQRFAAEVLRAANENVALTERALAEGEVSVTDVLVLRGAAVAAQLEYLEVAGAAAEAWFELAAALGADPEELPALVGGGR